MHFVIADVVKTMEKEDMCISRGLSILEGGRGLVIERVLGRSRESVHDRRWRNLNNTSQFLSTIADLSSTQRLFLIPLSRQTYNMATLLLPPSRSYDAQRHSSLLHLDCSTDLRAYSRSLGPVPAQSVPIPTISDDDLRRHFEPQGRDLNAVIRSARPTYHAPLPPPTQRTPFSDMPIPPRSTENTYSRALREALDASSRFSGSPSAGTIYTVLDELQAVYMDSWTNIVGSSQTLHNANLKAADHFVQTYDPKPDDAELEIKLRDDGSLYMQLEHDEGLQSVYVEPTSIDI